MPTGYTAGLYDGEQSFEDYAWGVARGFGALIEMRDAPRDAPIPEDFGADTSYHDRYIEEARADLRALDTMSVEEAGRRALGEHHESAQHRARETARREAIRGRYEAMLEKARAWDPPTADHIEFKRTMVEQLEESIKFDCNIKYLTVEPLLTPQEWIDKERKRAEKDLAYHTAEREKDIDRARSRTAWVQALRESLGGVPA